MFVNPFLVLFYVIKKMIPEGLWNTTSWILDVALSVSAILVVILGAVLGAVVSAMVSRKRLLYTGQRLSGDGSLGIVRHRDADTRDKISTTLQEPAEAPRQRHMVKRLRYVALGAALALLAGTAWWLYVNLSRGDADDYSKRALDAAVSGDHDKAIAEFTEAIRLFPERAPEFYVSRAFEFLQKGDRNTALADYTEALRHKPNWDVALWNRGNTYEEMGLYDQAMADYGQALQAIRPGHPVKIAVLSRRGSIYFSKGQPTRALADFEEAIALDQQIGSPDDRGLSQGRANLYAARAKVYRALGQAAKAAADEGKVNELRKR
jgi:tetratricopeptide (TPR) repeat protein